MVYGVSGGGGMKLIFHFDFEQLNLREMPKTKSSLE
jgi:hypothetical protein